MAANEGKVERAQTIFRVAKNADNPFVMIDRRVIENPKLSWKAKGLLAYLLSRPDNWVVRFGDLVKRAPDGAHTIRQAMKELKTAGHVKVTTERDGGRITRWIYEVFEAPPVSTSPDVENQQVEILQVENLPFNNTDSVNETDCTDINTGADAPPVPASFGIDWQIAGGNEKVVIPDNTDALMKDAAQLIATGSGVRSPEFFAIAYAFMKARGLVIAAGKIKSQRKPIREMIESGVTHRHVTDATKKLLEAQMTVTDLYSVSKTAIDLAHPAPGSTVESAFDLIDRVLGISHG
jgi:hypothetical protein